LGLRNSIFGARDFGSFGASSEAPRRKNDQKREINGLGFRRGSTSEKDPERTSIGIAAGRMAP
jgi:hypothetical protein